MTNPKFLVIGGGPSGLSAAQDIAEAGGDAILVEKETFLGGTPKKLHYSLLAPDMKPVEEVLDPLINSVESSDVRRLLGSNVKSVEKKGGRFNVTIESDGSSVMESVDAIIVATGFSHWDPHKKYEYAYGVYPDVIDFKDFEKMLSDEKIVRPSNGQQPKRIAWLLCVGSRDKQVGKFYCCRLGCAVSIKQAMEVRRMHPEIDTYVYYMAINLPSSPLFIEPILPRMYFTPYSSIDFQYSLSSQNPYVLISM